MSHWQRKTSSAESMPREMSFPRPLTRAVTKRSQRDDITCLNENAMSGREEGKGSMKMTRRLTHSWQIRAARSWQPGRCDTPLIVKLCRRSVVGEPDCQDCSHCSQRGQPRGSGGAEEIELGAFAHS